MTGPNILVSDPLEQAGLDLLSHQAKLDYKPEISAAALQAAIPEYEALIVRSRTRVTSELIAAADRLKVIGRAGVGVDNIDLKSAGMRDIYVVNTPTATSSAVAEHTLGLMMALSRHIPAADASMKAGRWEKKCFKGNELGGKTLGVLGLGHIGARVVQYALAFGMQCLAYDPYLSAQEIYSRGAQPVSFDSLLGNSDYVTLHLPLTDETRHLLGADEFSQMKPGARLVCTARGGIIDEEALAAALDAGQLTGAALDVYADEPPLAGSIAAHPAVVATPHIASQTVEAQIRAAVAIAEEVLSVLNGEPPRWPVKT